MELYKEKSNKCICGKTLQRNDFKLISWDNNPWVWVIEFKRVEGK